MEDTKEWMGESTRDQDMEDMLITNISKKGNKQKNGLFDCFFLKRKTDWKILKSLTLEELWNMTGIKIYPFRGQFQDFLIFVVLIHLIRPRIVYTQIFVP